MLLHEFDDGFGGALAKLAAVEIHAAHARVGGERNEVRFVLRDFAAAQAVLLFGQHHDGAAFRRFVGQARKLRGVGQFVFRDAADGDELHGLAVAQRDGAGLIQQQRVHVARGFHGFAAHGQHVVLHHAIHAGDADGGEQAADGGRESGRPAARPAPRRWAPGRCRPTARCTARTAAA